MDELKWVGDSKIDIIGDGDELVQAKVLREGASGDGGGLDGVGAGDRGGVKDSFRITTDTIRTGTIRSRTLLIRDGPPINPVKIFSIQQYLI